MLSIDYSVTVSDYPWSLIRTALVRGHPANFTVQLINDGPDALRNLSVRAVLESYVGTEKPIIFHRADSQAVVEIPAKGMVPLEFVFYPIYPGVASLAIQVTNVYNKPEMAKRPSESAYREQPVRYWMYVQDDISVDTLVAMNKIVEGMKPKEKTK